MNHTRLVLGMLLIAGTATADDAVERGRKALLGRAFTPPAFGSQAYENVWKLWGLKEKPADFDRLFRERYGLHKAEEYDNGKYPMGLRVSRGLLGPGLATDCMTCHGGSIAGKSYVGLGNTSIEYHALITELDAAGGRKPGLKFHATRVRGTTEAHSMAVFLLGLREPDLGLRTLEKWVDLGLHDEMCQDTPAWWLLKKKKTMYPDGSMSTESVRALMQFMLMPLNLPADIEREEKNFADIREFILSLKPPKYVFDIDDKKAAEGQKLFEKNCKRCHGTYGEKWTYPNKVIPLDEIGTDPTRFKGQSEKFGKYYNTTWFAKTKDGKVGFKGKVTSGYQAPPLDGIWATAPYFHNGSVPTVYHVLNSKARPKIFTRSYRTGKEDYDPKNLGWKITELKEGPAANLPAIERRKVYDTTQRGRGNGGHTFGDGLKEAERFAIIEYLKTL